MQSRNPKVKASRIQGRTPREAEQVSCLVRAIPSAIACRTFTIKHKPRTRTSPKQLADHHLVNHYSPEPEHRAWHYKTK